MKLKGTFTAPLLVVIVMFLTAASRFLDLSALAYNENICLAVIVVQLVTLAVPTVFYTRLRGQKFLARMRFRLFSPDKLLVTLLASLTLIFGDILLKLGLKSIGIIDGDYSVYGWFFKASGADADLIYSLMTFAVIPSVAEELLFRGVLPVDVRHELRVFSGLFFVWDFLFDAYLSDALDIGSDAVSPFVQRFVAHFRRDDMEDTRQASKHRVSDFRGRRNILSRAFKSSLGVRTRLLPVRRREPRVGLREGLSGFFGGKVF